VPVIVVYARPLRPTVVIDLKTPTAASEAGSAHEALRRGWPPPRRASCLVGPLRGRTRSTGRLLFFDADSNTIRLPLGALDDDPGVRPGCHGGQRHRATAGSAVRTARQFFE
jgi:hypothetical protein